MSFYVVVHGDKAAVEKIKAEREAKQEAAQKERFAKRMEMKKRQENARNNPVSKSTGNTSARIDVLEKRMRRMEATLDLILEKVQK